MENMTASRLTLMVILGAGLLASPLAAEAQEYKAGEVYRLGYLSPNPPDTFRVGIRPVKSPPACIRPAGDVWGGRLGSEAAVEDLGGATAARRPA